MPSSNNDVATQLEKLATLRDRGVLTAEEFQAQKAKILSQ
jgi:Short C-terminal domain